MRRREFGQYCLGLVLATASACPAVVDLRAVASDGQAAPGVDGATLRIEPSPFVGRGPVDARNEALGPSGAVAFASDLGGDGFSGTYNEAVWLWENGTLTLLARTGQPLPGLAGETLTQLNSLPSIDASSRVSFLGTTNRPGTAIFEAAIGPGGAPAVTPVFRTGDVLPDDPRPVADFGLTPNPGRPFRVSPSGTYVIDGSRYDPNQPVTSGGSNPPEDVVFAGRPGQLTTVISRNAFPTPDNWSHVSTTGITDGGRPVLTISAGSYAAGTPGNSYTILAPAAGGGFRTVAATGAPAPATGGTLLNPVATAGRGPAVAVTAYALHNHDGADPTYDQGVWVDRGDGALTLAARYDDPAPGTPDTFQYVTAGAVNSSGDVLITGDLGTDQTAHGLWLWRGGTLTNLALTHDGASGPHRITGIHLNEPGQVVFATTVHVQPAFAAPYDTLDSIWGGAIDAPRPLISLGDTVDVGGAPHVVTGLDLSTLTDASGGPQILNDAGQLLFAAQLDSGNWGLFLATVPEPEAALLLIAATVTVGRRHRPRI